MGDWNEQQEEFIGKLEKTQAIFDEILEKDPNGMVIPFGEDGGRSKLLEQQAHNRKILDKLKSKEFTVAIVGLEKAGKSTLGNALLGLNILPEYAQRCTYTTTKIYAGTEDKGKIEFYSKAEFAKDFSDMLKGMHYEGTADFDTMDIVSFEHWWQSMEEKEPEIYQIHNGTTFEDIKAILMGRPILQKLLGTTLPPFNGEQMQSQEFKKYITGMEKINEDGTIKRSPHPYAVKRVLIESAKLGAMEHIVLYDVPGFDSPTALHKKQTEEMLIQADAIILVTNVGTNPNLTSPQLDMLRKGRDEDNVPLRDKAFVFGNKLDLARDASVAKGNMAALRDDAVNKHRIALEDRVLCGSVMAYLESLGKAPTNESSTTLDNWDITPGGYGVKALWSKMEDYYNNDRFAVLRRRAENTITEARKYLEEILYKLESADVPLIETGGEYYMQAVRDLKKFREEAYVLGENCRDEILESKIFSNKLRTNIETIFPKQTVDSELLIRVKRSGNINVNGQLSLTRLNALLREELARQFLSNIVSIVAEESDKKEQEFYQKLNDKFLEVMGMPMDSPYRQELKESVDKLFHDMWVKNAESCHFNSLVERFTSGLLEAMISRPFASYERFEAIAGADTFPEFLSLAIYYENSPDFTSEDEDTKQIDFFAKILLHKDCLSDKKNEGVLGKFFEENKDALRNGASLALDLLPMSKWGKMLLKAGIKLDEMTPELKRNLSNTIYKSDWANLSQNEKKQRLEEIIERYAEETPSVLADNNVDNAAGSVAISDNPLVKKLLAMHYMSKREEPKTEQEMLDILNEDIENLQEFTLKAVIYAMGLERAFIAVITKNTNRIRKDEEHDEGAQLFNNWISDNIRRVKVNEFRSLDQRNIDNQTRKNIVESVRKVVDKLEA